MNHLARSTRRGAARLSENFGVFLSGMLVAIFLTQAWPYYADVRDDQPWVSARVAVLPRTDGLPVIAYDLAATRNITAIWYAHLEDPDGNRLSRTFSGLGRYRTDRGGYREWPWVDFFEGNPAVPARPFRVCLSYSMTSRAGVERDTGPFCSDVTSLEEVGQ